MFEHNKWYWMYVKIMLNATDRGLNKNALTFYTEKHHVIPRSLGGSNDEYNYVLLTAKEHFVCHHLLTKCVVGKNAYSVKHAFSQMVYCGNFTPTARHYDKARSFYAIQGRSKEWRQNISNALRGRKMPREYVEKMKKRLTGRKLTNEHKENIRKASIKRGISLQCRAARLENLIKTFVVIYPTGEAEIIKNLKQYCLNNNINYPSAANNSKTKSPISRGPLKGYNFLLKEENR